MGFLRTLTKPVFGGYQLGDWFELEKDYPCDGFSIPEGSYKLIDSASGTVKLRHAKTGKDVCLILFDNVREVNSSL